MLNMELHQLGPTYVDRRPRHGETLADYIERVICGFRKRPGLAELFEFRTSPYIEPSYVWNPVVPTSETK